MPSHVICVCLHLFLDQNFNFCAESEVPYGLNFESFHMLFVYVCVYQIIGKKHKLIHCLQAIIYNVRVVQPDVVLMQKYMLFF